MKFRAIASMSIVVALATTGVAADGWLDVTTNADIAYFLIEEPPSIQRFSLSGQSHEAGHSTYYLLERQYCPTQGGDFRPSRRLRLERHVSRSRFVWIHESYPCPPIHSALEVRERERR